MKDFANLYPQLGFAGGGGLVATYLAHMVVRFQRDFTNRYAVELHRTIEDCDHERRRANRYAVELARHGIEVPPDEEPPTTVLT